MTVSELISVLGVTRRSQKRRLLRLCPVPQDHDKVTVLFHIDNIYVDAIFKMDSISVATIEGVKREFIAWIDELEKQIKNRKVRLCGIEISVVTTPKYSYFSYVGSATPATLAAYEPNMNRFEKILYEYLKNKASVIFNRWFILTIADNKLAVVNTPMGIYRATELIRPAVGPTTAKQNANRAAITNIAPKGNFATKIFSFGNRLKRQPPPNKVVNLQRNSSPTPTRPSVTEQVPSQNSQQREAKK